ncbi:MAG: HAD-IIIA family hydrolase [bacterium]
MRARRIKLVVFDLDGTLADTARDLADSVNELRHRFGLTKLSDSAVARHVGQGVGHLLSHTLPPAARAVHPDYPAAFSAIYRRRCVHRTRLFPGAAAALRRLKAEGYRLAVATNKPGGLSRRILRRLGVLRLFGAVLGGDDVVRKKPHPEVMRTLMRRFHAKPSETVLVGDSRFDMDTGRRARCRLVAVTWGFGSRRELLPWRPAAVISRCSALGPAIARLALPRYSR